MADMENNTAGTQETPQDAPERAEGANTQTTPETPQDEKQSGAQTAPANKRRSTSKKAAENKPIESAYSAADLARAARARFGVPPEIVTAAMRMTGKKKATLTEAQEIIKNFMAREVN